MDEQIALVEKVRSAIPAVRVPEDDDYESWTDEELIQRGLSRLAQGDRHEAKRITLGRMTIKERLEAGHVLSIVRRRHKEDGRWCEMQTQYCLPRTTVWEVIEAYERSTEAGHTTEDVVGSHDTWTEVLRSYGVTKERAKEKAVPVAVKAEPVDEAHVGEIEIAPADTDSTQAVQQEVGAVAADAVAASKAKRAGKKDQGDDKATQILLEKPGAVEITEDESIAYRKFVESVGGLARAEVVFAEMKRRADHA